MNKYYYSLVIFALILFSANGQSNVWIQINKETRNWAEKNLSKCENISIKTLIPFLQEENNTPYVYLSMGHIFYGLRVNYSFYH
jgi:hypothetical protein